MHYELVQVEEQPQVYCSLCWEPIEVCTCRNQQHEEEGDPNNYPPFSDKDIPW